MNDQVSEYEKAARLREISQRLEPKAVGRLKDGKLFRRDDLFQEGRTLLHEGTVTWKSSVRQKGLREALCFDTLALEWRQTVICYLTVESCKVEVVTVDGFTIIYTAVF